MSFETELKELIAKWLPEQVTICTGKVTYRQTLETPEEYEEIEVYLNAEAFMEYYSEDIDNLICVVNDAESCEFTDKLEKDWEEPSPY